MRHKYETRGIVLSRSPLGEASAFVTLITPELGLVRARAQSVRRSGAKLASALATFAQSSLVLVHGREGWRVAGAVLEENWLAGISSETARDAAARISGLLLRLVAGEVRDPRLFEILTSFFKALTHISEETYQSAEALAALRIVAALGLDEGHIPGDTGDFTAAQFAEIDAARSDYIARINRGISASGL
jgi:DNA repair protein RecO (recombination protein O)